MKATAVVDSNIMGCILRFNHESIPNNLQDYGYTPIRHIGGRNTYSVVSKVWTQSLTSRTPITHER